MRKILIILLIIINIPLIGQTTYYVSSSDGDDDDTGLTPALAWATLDKVETMDFGAGDSVLFKCGDSWRESMYFDGGTAYGRVVYSSYGTGAKPLFMAQAVDVSDGWTNVSGNVWQHDTTLFSTDVGNLIFNNEQYIGHMENDSSQLNQQGEWFYSFVNDRVWLYSTSNPSTYYTHIEAAIRPTNGKWAWAYPIDDEDYITIDGLDFRYSGAGGLTGYNCSNVTIRNCNHSYNGGCYENALKDTTNAGKRIVRYGGGIATWGDVSNWLVEDCTIDNEYDSGGTNQYTHPTVGVVVDSVIWRRNLITNCEYGYELFIRPNTSSMRAVYFENNTVAYSGYGWSHDERPDGQNGSALRISAITTDKSEIYYRNNIFYMATDQLFLLGPLTDVDNTVLDFNCIYNLGAPIAEVSGTSYNTFSAWKALSSQDANSINSEPVFVSASNYNLQSSSPCIDAGTNVGLSYEGIAPDIGAFEYTPVGYWGTTFVKDKNGNLMRDANNNIIKIVK